jgi:curved DNA-binding protein CbpA
LGGGLTYKPVMPAEVPLIKLKRKMTAYEILSVDPKSVDRHKEIKRNYRLLSTKHHPDRGGVAEVFHAIAEAYDRIGDTAKRFQYDKLWPEGKLIDMNPVIEKLNLKPLNPSADKLPPVPSVPRIPRAPIAMLTDGSRTH